MPSQADKNAARHALAKIAVGIADGTAQEGHVHDFLEDIFQHGPNVPADVQAEFHAVFDDLTAAELQKFGRMQKKMVGLRDNKGYDTLAEVVNPTLSKF